MAQALTDFLAEAVRRQFRWGQHDCMLFAADWARALTGVDPAASLRGAYDSRCAAEILIERFGGHEALVGRLLEGSGWTRVAEPRAGNIGIVTVPTRQHPNGGVAAAVCTGRRGTSWALVTSRGLYIGAAPHVAAWVHHG